MGPWSGEYAWTVASLLLKLSATEDARLLESHLPDAEAALDVITG